MTATGQMVIRGVVHPAVIGRGTLAHVGLTVRGPARAIAAAMSSAIFVARTLGRFDVLVTVRAFSAAQLVESSDSVRVLPGVGGLDSWAHLEVVEESYASGLG